MNTEHKTTEGEIKEIWERLTAGESSIKSAHKRIDSLEKLAESVNNLAFSTSQIATETKALREDYEKADERIESLEEKPIKRYETVITAILTALCGGVIGYLLALIIPTIK
jgi:predicted  nucleic acid-binding Zn-ribbon protein